MFFDILNKEGLWIYNITSSSWFTWDKPDQYQNFFIMACGAGGGGGNGFSGAASTNRGGGGGGAGGQIMNMYAPSFLLPDTLYISVGAGGAGIINGRASSVLNQGNTTYVNYYPNLNISNIILNAAGGGAGGIGLSTGTAAGGIGLPNSPTNTLLSISAQGASAGTPGGINTGDVGTNFSATTSCIYGGTGGGSIGTANTAFAGGNILASDVHPQINGGAINSNGSAGVFIKKPFSAIGGTGGGSSTNIGGNGGNGVWGSGGGGGGGGIIGGNGGNGGNGFVIIIGF